MAMNNERVVAGNLFHYGPTIKDEALALGECLMACGNKGQVLGPIDANAECLDKAACQRRIEAKSARRRARTRRAFDAWWQREIGGR